MSLKRLFLPPSRRWCIAIRVIDLCHSPFSFRLSEAKAFQICNSQWFARRENISQEPLLCQSLNSIQHLHLLPSTSSTSTSFSYLIAKLFDFMWFQRWFISSKRRWSIIASSCDVNEPRSFLPVPSRRSYTPRCASISDCKS